MAPDPTGNAGSATAPVWDHLDDWWDEAEQAEGSAFHHVLVRPATEELLGVRGGERIIDVACGNGQFSRRLAELGTEVVAFDYAQSLVERARAYRSEHSDRIEYRVADATDEAQIRALGPGPFDAAVANMILMGLPKLEPLFAALGTMLRPGGRVVFTVLHPCFPYSGVVRRSDVAEGGHRSDPTIRRTPVTSRLARFGKRGIPPRLRGRLARGSLALSSGRHALSYREAATLHRLLSGHQPVPFSLFHRPLEKLLEPAFSAGFVLDRLVEPAWPGTPGRAVLLGVRLRLPCGDN